MHNNHERKTFVRFAVLILLVLILVSLFMLLFLRKRTSQQLSHTIREMGTVMVTPMHLDKAMQLLYRADNHFRLYTVTWDKQFYSRYQEELNGLSAELDTLLTDSTSNGAIHRLLAGKAAKMQVFIACREQLDTLLALQQAYVPPAISLPERVIGQLNRQAGAQTDTVVTTSEVTTRSKKKLFGRLKDAIANKPALQQQRSQVNVVHHHPAANKAQLEYIQSAYDQLFNDAAKTKRNMNHAEQDLVVGSTRIFATLDSLLQQARENILAAATEERQAQQAAATGAVHRIWQQSYWEIPLVLLLAGLIVYGIMRLYRYDLALLRSQQQAERLARQKSEFAATISHELRTPIHSVLGYTQQLKQEYKPETVSAIRTGAEMLLQVVNNVLDYTKIETHKLVLKQEKFSPRAAIEEVCNALLVQAEMKNLQMTVNIYFPTTLLVCGDAFRLKQVITNLVANAIKYTETGDITITASMRQTDTSAHLMEVAVTDTGIGIHNRDLPQLFDAFTQAGTPDASFVKAAGSGLGLHIAKKIIDLHEGKIYVKSIHGKGSTFYFEIKYPPVEHTPATRKVTVPVNVGDLERHSALTRILVVEDSVLNQKLLSLMLDRMQVHYKVVSNAEEGLLAFDTFRFDIVLTDIDLPGMDGLAMAQAIRNWPDKEKAAVTIIAITGNVLEEDLALYLKSGFSDYIMKPYREEDILEKLQLFGMPV
ncbi:His Kinase A (phospho-acceptor) domain-containing protein [Chitinophaga jiangningensis]|uniref:histidine kinase n=1 Tax=Chitinophaga jiangningensis TaxID=1419482 RepID=A0A1M7KGF9_9BACT|nr:ATP-binding protein [Chitinophaga jiangningensis]SHM64435.1 His Kinase A (phospho-acceptor) domain-containing protein [Chitinophaga jiangningensis]